MQNDVIQRKNVKQNYLIMLFTDIQDYSVTSYIHAHCEMINTEARIFIKRVFFTFSIVIVSW